MDLGKTWNLTQSDIILRTRHLFQQNNSYLIDGAYMSTFLTDTRLVLRAAQPPELDLLFPCSSWCSLSSSFSPTSYGIPRLVSSCLTSATGWGTLAGTSCSDRLEQIPCLPLCIPHFQISTAATFEQACGGSVHLGLLTSGARCPGWDDNFHRGRGCIKPQQC